MSKDDKNQKSPRPADDAPKTLENYASPQSVEQFAPQTIDQAGARAESEGAPKTISGGLGAADELVHTGKQERAHGGQQTIAGGINAPDELVHAGRQEMMHGGQQTIAGNVMAPPTQAPDAAFTPGKKREPEVNKLFRMVMKNEGSDLHLKVGLPPMMRLKGIIRQAAAPPLSQEDMERLLYPTLEERQRKILEETGGVDYSYVIGDDECRFRVNLFKQRGKLSLVARRVNNSIPTFAGLHLPASIEKLCHFDQGLIILAGVTGSGKSTTIASMLDYINTNEHLHILTIEDPIEFTFNDRKSVINQREVGLDVDNWHTALKHAVRQDPDIILVGEMRDQDTFEAGVHAAETGHLVFGTIHASSASSTISRILDLFPPTMHHAVRQALAFNLKAIIAQKLLPSIIPGVQRVPTNEIMIVNPTVKELIMKSQDQKLSDAIRIGFNEGMLDFTESLRQLVENKKVDQATALEVAPNPEQLKMALKGIKVAAPGIL